jgi:hypothetical protein
MTEYLHKQKNHPSRRPTKNGNDGLRIYLQLPTQLLGNLKKNRQGKSKPQGLSEETTTTTD